MRYVPFKNSASWLAIGMLDHPHQNDSTIILKTLMFICMNKFNLIPHFIHKILHFEESYNLVGTEDWFQGAVLSLH